MKTLDFYESKVIDFFRNADMFAAASETCG